MKQWTFVLGVFAFAYSTGAWACPNLEGEYQCDIGQGGWDMQVTQTTTNGITEYQIVSNGETVGVVADGQTRSIPDTDEMKNSTYKASCSGDLLDIDLAGEAYQEGNLLGKMVVDYHFLKDGQNIALKVNGTFNGHAFPEQKGSCQRK